MPRQKSTVVIEMSAGALDTNVPLKKAKNSQYKLQTWHACLFYFLANMVVVTMNSMGNEYLKHHWYFESKQLGLIAALSMSTFAGSLFWPSIVHRNDPTKFSGSKTDEASGIISRGPCMILCTLVYTVLLDTLWVVQDSKWVNGTKKGPYFATILLFVSSFFLAALMPLLDELCMEIIGEELKREEQADEGWNSKDALSEEQQLQAKQAALQSERNEKRAGMYARVRLWGTFGHFLVSLLIGLSMVSGKKKRGGESAAASVTTETPLGYFSQGWSSISALLDRIRTSSFKPLFVILTLNAVSFILMLLIFLPRSATTSSGSERKKLSSGAAGSILQNTPMLVLMSVVMLLGWTRSIQAQWSVSLLKSVCVLKARAKNATGVLSDPAPTATAKLDYDSEDERAFYMLVNFSNSARTILEIGILFFARKLTRHLGFWGIMGVGMAATTLRSGLIGWMQESFGRGYRFALLLTLDILKGIAGAAFSASATP